MRCTRLEHCECIVWIDALCIDQNVVEKSIQVQKMPAIYESAVGEDFDVWRKRLRGCEALPLCRRFQSLHQRTFVVTVNGYISVLLLMKRGMVMSLLL